MMTRQIFAALSILLAILFARPLQAQIDLHKEEMTAGRYRLMYINTGYAYSIIETSGKKFISFAGLVRSSDDRSYPTRDLYIIVPPNSKPAVHFAVTQQQEVPADGITNLPTVNAPHYEVKGFLWLDSYYCMHVVIDPFWYDAAFGKLVEIREFRLDVDLPAQPTASLARTSTPMPTPVENVRYGPQWESAASGYSIPSSDAWIDYSQDYLKIGVAQDGIYRLTYSDLVRYGIPVGSINPHAFKLYMQGKEIPIYVHGEDDNVFDPADYIEFLGRRNYGDVRYREIAPYGSSYYEYLNRYSDTTMYWLNWEGGAGKRLDTLAALTAAPADTIRYYDELIHSERNIYWDFALSGGDVRKNSPEIYENETWNDVPLGVGTFSASFTIGDLYPGRPARAFVKIGDYASSVDSNAHDLSLSINSDPTVYDRAFSNKYKGRVLTANFTSTVLANGTNKVNITSYPTLNTINTIIPDWYELEFPRYLVTAADSLSFSYRSPIQPRLVNFIITGLSNAPMSLYRFVWADSSVARITVYSRNSDTLRFSDTVATGRSYFLAASGKVASPIIFYKKKFTNLRNAANQADYLAITHSYFSPLAKEYVAFIASTYHITAKLIDVQDIYDEYNYGFFAPEPIRDFLQSTHIYWQQPYPQYAFLIGKGTYDFYGNKTKYFGVTRTPNFVPSYGNPVSDTWFTMWDTTGSMIPRMSIGRLPAKSIDEFQFYFSKHQKYIAKGYDDWNKRYIFFSGGNFTDSDQLAQAKAVNDFIIANYVSVPPIGGQYANFYKTASPITNFGPYSADYIQNAIDQGGMFISYLGHSGTQTWDNSITDITQLSNIRDRNPLITDFGCSTGKFAEPDVFSFSELAVNDSKGQAIGYIGNSSLGFTTTAYTFPQVFYKKLLIDTAVSIGETHRLAKLDYLKQFGASGVFGLFVETNTLIGDPIVTLPIPPKPNFSFSTTSITMQPQRVTEQTDSIGIIFGYNNLGKVPIDSLDLRIKDDYQGVSSYSQMMRRKIPSFFDSLSISLPVKGKPGEHDFSIILDPLNKIDEIYKNDNTLSYSFVVASSTIRNMEISSLANQTAGTIRFLNPSVNPSSGSFIVEESENSAFFPSRIFQVPFDTFYTKFRVDSSLVGRRIWLRTKFDASSPEGLTYSYIVGDKDNYLLGDTVTLSTIKRDGIGIFNKRMLLDTTKTIISAISGGANDGNTAVVSKNGQNFIPENTLRGFHVCIFDASTYDFLFYFRFDVQSGSAVWPQFQTLLDTLGTGYLVVIAISNDVASNGNYFPASLKASIKKYGSYYIDSVGIADSWAIIGHKGASPGSVPEKFAKRYNGHSVSIDTTFRIPNVRGTFETDPVGPVAAWKNAVVNFSNLAGGALRLSVIGLKANNTADTVQTMVLADSTIDLSGLNASQYPSLKLSGELDRSPGQASPSVGSIAINYDQLAELGVNYQTVHGYLIENGSQGRELAVGDTVLQGEKILLKYRVYNAGGAAAKKFGVNAAAVWDNSNTEPIASTVIDSLAPQSFKELSGTYNTALGSGRRSLRVSVDPDTVVRELFKDNNIYAFPVYVRKDSSKPLLPNLFITDKGIIPLVTPVTDENDSARFAIVYGNSGAFINDSVTIAIRQYYKDANVASWTVRRKYPAETDTIYINVPILKRAGEHHLQVELDPVGLIVESSESDNTANYYFTVTTTDFKILQPTAFSTGAYSKIIFLNPTTAPTGAAGIADLQIDSSAAFTTANTIQVPMQTFTTAYDISALPKSTRYYWRIKQEQSSRDWTTGTFYLGESVVYSIGQADSAGWGGNTYDRAAYSSSSGARIADTRTAIRALSAGFSDGRTGTVEVNGLNVIAPIFGTGHNVVVMDTSTYSVTARRRFDISNTAAESDSLTQFIAQVATGALVIDVVVDEGANNLLQATRDALKTIGSAQIDRLSRRDSWAIIGRKGAAPGTVPESYVPQFSGSASVETTFVRKEYNGTIITKAFGPLAKLSSFSMTGTIPNGTSIQTKFIGLRFDNRMDTVLLTSGNALTSSGIQNSVNYKEGSIIFSLQASANANPSVTSWRLSAMPAAELAISAQTASISRSQVMQGEPIVFNGTIHNVSSEQADSVTVQLSVNENGFDKILKQQRFASIAGYDSAAFTYTYSSKGKSGSYAFTMTIDPADSIIEESKDNNIVSIPFVVAADTVRPQIQIMVDGQFVLDGDYVRQNPEIVIRYTDNNPSAITSADTSNFRIQLNNLPVYFTPGTTELLPSTTPGQAQLKWSPSLPGGENFIQVFAVDVAGNSSDTTTLFVNVSTDFVLRDIYNLPNPFAGSTAFTFNLLSPVTPDEVSIKIFTVAGRLIQDLTAPCRIGFNKIFWDGRDKDGDEIANGVYFYKVIVKQGNQQTNGISKLVKMK